MHRTHGSSRAVSRIAPSVIAVGALQLLLVIARCWSTREAPTAGDALMVLLACVVTAAALGYRERRQGTRLERSEAPAEPLAASWRPALLLGLIPLASWAAMYLAFGPFVSMNDTFYIIQNPIGQASGHPIVYSLVVSAFLRGGGTGSFVALAALQMALFYGMVAGALRMLDLMGVSLRLRAALAVLIALVPLMSDYTFAIVKDAPFLAFTVITSLCLVQVHRTAGASLARPAFALVCVLAIVGFGVTRNNGLPLVLVICGLLVLLSSRARTRAAVIAGIACLLAFTPQALVREHVGEQRFVEAVGVPLQMVGGTLAGDPTCVPEQAREYFDQIMPIGEWVARYDPQNVDRVKFSPPFRGDVLQDSKRTFLMMTARTFAACPGPMLQGYLLHTGPLWSTNSPPLIETSQSVFLEPVSNRPGNLAEMNAYYDGLGASRWSAPLGSLTDEVRAAYSASIRLMPPVGVWIGALLSLALVSLVRRRWDVALLVLPSLLVWATLLVAAPVGFQFRYVAYAPWILLIGAVMLVGARAPSRRPDAGRRARPGSSAAGRHVARR